MNNMFAIPDEAQDVQVLLKDDGAAVIRWFAPSFWVEGQVDFWSVALAADRRAVDVVIRYAGAYPPFLDQVLSIVCRVLQYSSGINVALSMTPDPVDAIAT